MSPADDAHTQDDETLASRAAQGDELAVDVLVERHLTGLEAFVRLRAGDILKRRESAADLVQSAVREVLQHSDRLQHGGEKGFKAWLYDTALRKIRNRHRYWQAQKRDGKEQALSQEDATRLMTCYAGITTPSQDALAREQLERLEHAMAALSEEQREVVAYSRLVGLSHAEIGERIGKSEVATRTILFRALSQLTDLLDRS